MVVFENSVHVSIKIDNGLLCQMWVTYILEYNKNFHRKIIKAPDKFKYQMYLNMKYIRNTGSQKRSNDIHICKCFENGEAL